MKFRVWIRIVIRVGDSRGSEQGGQSQGDPGDGCEFAFEHVFLLSRIELPPQRVVVLR